MRKTRDGVSSATALKRHSRIAPAIGMLSRRRSLTDAAPRRVDSTNEEQEFAREVQAWLRQQSRPEMKLLWLPHWSTRHPVEVAGVAELAGLIAGLEIEDRGGIRAAVGDGRWAQVKCMPDEQKLLELHPYAHDRASRPFVWDSFPDLSAGDAAARAWRWLQSTAR